MRMNELPGGLRRCLWIAREMPFPLISGDRVYSAGLAGALAGLDVQVSFLAHEGGKDRQPGPDRPGMRWVGISGGTRNYEWVALTSPMPVTAAIHDTAAARERLTMLLLERFDAIVFDQLGAGWALPTVQRWIADRERESQGRPYRFLRPALIYVAHNHEQAVWAAMARDARGSLLRRLGVRNNAAKVGRLEARLVRAVDRVVNITEEDAAAMVRMGASPNATVITPGYSSEPAPMRTITAQTPRRVVMVGSFKWAIKEENLRQFLAVADPVFAQRGIHFDVVGRIPEPLRQDLEPTLKATTLHGFVDDINAVFAKARMAVVPELIGGGFKLKFLDYIFGRMPVASIGPAAAGLPPAIRNCLVTADDLPELVEAIVRHIDDIDGLNAMHRTAFEVASTEYRWRDRGERLKRAMEDAMDDVMLSPMRA